MMFIRIVRRPIGHAPEWVRDAWIGLSLPTPQRSPRSLRGLSVLSRSGGGLFTLVDTLRGKRPRVSGFIVNGKAAVDLLAETQPAAAEWWRTNAPTFLTGRQFLIFDTDCCEPLGGTPSAAGLLWGSQRFRKAYPASPGRIALLWTITNLVRILDVMLFPGEEMRSVSSILYLSGTAIFAAFLASWVLRLRGSTLHLVSALVSLDLFMTCVAFGMKFISPTPNAAYWLLAGLYSVVIANMIGRGFSGLRSKKRRATAILLVLAANIGAGSLQAADGAFWQLASVVRPLFGRPDPFEQEDNSPPEIAADLLWGAQPALVQKQIIALRPRTAGTMNVYAMAVSGSGTQALFSREAHEALRVAALHFGDSSRGGTLLSNGAVDLMQAPLATRDNITAVAKGIGEKFDHRQDLLFLYLASHGSRTGELASELPDYHSVQPISSVSTAEALRKGGVSRRVIVVSACFAATWIPALADDDTIVITAAAKDRTSFGCDDSRRLTLFGASFLSSLASKDISLHDAFEGAKRKISIEEKRQKTTPSFPEAFVGRNMAALWLGKPSPASTH